jgi:hypothetical protein
VTGRIRVITPGLMGNVLKTVSATKHSLYTSFKKLFRFLNTFSFV